MPDVDSLSGADAVLVSHLHHDHLDLRSLRRLGRPIVASEHAAEFLGGRRGMPEVRGVRSGESVPVGPLTVTAVPAEHGGGRYGRSGEGEALGYLIEGGGPRVYFAGDTDLFEGMSELAGRVDVAVIPIWGWGPSLGPGHLDPETAAEALARIGPRIAVPIHHATLSLPGSGRLWPWLLAEPAERFVAAAAERAPEVDVRVLRPGESTALR
jgi:L-ascorbate metabolism protein UlaG (beta-lactamase superfamily)